MSEINSSGESKKIVIQKNWNLRRKLTAIFLLPVIFFAALIATIPVLVIYGLDVTEIPIVPALLATIVAEWAVIIWVFGFAGLKSFAKELLKVHRFRHLIWGAVVGALMFVGLQGGAILIQTLTNATVDSSQTSTMLGELNGIQAFLILIGVVALIGPITEEFLFRGVLVGALQSSSWNAPWISMVFSGVIFGIMHAQGFSTITDFFIIAWTGLMGALFALLFIKTKSIWTPVAGHVTYNLITSILLLMGAVNA